MTTETQMLVQPEHESAIVTSEQLANIVTTHDNIYSRQHPTGFVDIVSGKVTIRVRRGNLSAANFEQWQAMVDEGVPSMVLSPHGILRRVSSTLQERIAELPTNSSL